MNILQEQLILMNSYMIKKPAIETKFKNEKKLTYAFSSKNMINLKDYIQCPFIDKLKKKKHQKKLNLKLMTFKKCLWFQLSILRSGKLD